jgi:hypothetical protein
MRKYGVIAALSIVLIFLLTVAVLAIQVGSQSRDDQRQTEIASDRLDDDAHITQQLTEWAGYQVRLPDRAALPDILELTRARVTEAFDPETVDRREGEWWAELRWDKPREIGDFEGHPWFWAVITQGERIPIPDHAEPIALPITGVDGRMTHVVEETYERLTIWVTLSGIDVTLSVESVEPIDSADLDRVLATIEG